MNEEVLKGERRGLEGRLVVVGAVARRITGVSVQEQRLIARAVKGVIGDQQFTLMGIGVWLAIIMFLNVWGVIWPNQKRALGIIAVDDDKKARAARIAMLGSRTNLLLSLPMLTSMAMYQTLFG